MKQGSELPKHEELWDNFVQASITQAEANLRMVFRAGRLDNLRRLADNMYQNSKWPSGWDKDFGYACRNKKQFYNSTFKKEKYKGVKGAADAIKYQHFIKQVNAFATLSKASRAYNAKLLDSTSQGLNSV